MQVGLSSLEGLGQGGQLSSCIDLLLVIEVVANAYLHFPHSVILKSLVCRIKSLASKEMLCYFLLMVIYTSPSASSFQITLGNGGAI